MAADGDERRTLNRQKHYLVCLFANTYIFTNAAVHQFEMIRGDCSDAMSKYLMTTSVSLNETFFGQRCVKGRFVRMKICAT